MMVENAGQSLLLTDQKSGIRITLIESEEDNLSIKAEDEVTPKGLNLMRFLSSPMPHDTSPV